MNGGIFCQEYFEGIMPEYQSPYGPHGAQDNFMLNTILNHVSSRVKRSDLIIDYAKGMKYKVYFIKKK